MSGTEQVGWFDALGSDVPTAQRLYAAQEARNMGLDVEDSSEWVDEVATHIEWDEPKLAIETARDRLDLTGTYRFLAALCVPLDRSGEDVTD